MANAIRSCPQQTAEAHTPYPTFITLILKRPHSSLLLPQHPFRPTKNNSRRFTTTPLLLTRPGRQTSCPLGLTSPKALLERLLGTNVHLAYPPTNGQQLRPLAAPFRPLPPQASPLGFALVLPILLFLLMSHLTDLTRQKPAYGLRRTTTRLPQSFAPTLRPTTRSWDLFKLKPLPKRRTRRSLALCLKLYYPQRRSFAFLSRGSPPLLTTRLFYGAATEATC